MPGVGRKYKGTGKQEKGFTGSSRKPKGTGKVARQEGKDLASRAPSARGSKAPKTSASILAMIRADKSLSATQKAAMIKSVRQARGGVKKTPRAGGKHKAFGNIKDI